MNFRTQVPIPKTDFPIDYNSKIMSLGSCFAVNMAEKFDYFKFENSCNPFGILFHPLAIAKLIDFVLEGKRFTEEDLIFNNELWHCFDAHSDLSSPNKEELVMRLNAAVEGARQEISSATHLIITYGSSWVYRNIESQQLVANCHKVPQKQFKKELLSVAEIKESLAETMRSLRSVNPNCSVIFTVSPVRHIKDGFVENQLSKSNLIAALHTAFDFGLANLHYFPSYEIMMDELRDYRFYAEDMLHPSPLAIAYIWQQFSKSYLHESTYRVLQEVDKIQKGMAHRPFHPNSESHLDFGNKLQEKIKKLQTEFPFMKF